MEKQAGNSGRTRCWASVALGIILAAIAFAAMRIDLLNNYAYGVQISEELASVMVLAAIGVTSLPAAAALRGWDWLLRLATVASVLLTVWAAISAYADKQGKDILARQTIQQAYGDALKDAETARSEIKQAREEEAAIAELASVADLEVLAGHHRKQIAKETEARGGCGPNCRKAEEALQSVLNRMPAARAREAALGRAEAAQGRLEAAKAAAKEGDAEVSMLASYIAHQTGREAAEIARTIALATTGFAIITTIMMAALAHQAVTLIDQGLGRRPVPAPAHGPELAEVARNPFATPPMVACNPVAPEPVRVKKSSRDYWLARLRSEFPAVAARVERGEISCFAGCIATGLRKAPVRRERALDWTKADAYLNA